MFADAFRIWSLSLSSTVWGRGVLLWQGEI